MLSHHNAFLDTTVSCLSRPASRVAYRACVSKYGPKEDRLLRSATPNCPLHAGTTWCQIHRPMISSHGVRTVAGAQPSALPFSSTHGTLVPMHLVLNYLLTHVSARCLQLHCMEPVRVRQGAAASVLQAQQLLLLCAAAQHLCEPLPGALSCTSLLHSRLAALYHSTRSKRLRSGLSWQQGFRKSDPDLWQFANDHFVRGRKDLLTEIQRKKTTAAGKEAGAPGAAAIEVHMLRPHAFVMLPLGGISCPQQTHDLLHHPHLDWEASCSERCKFDVCREPGAVNAAVSAHRSASWQVGSFGGIADEVQALKRDKNVLMLELVRLRQQQQVHNPFACPL